MRWVTSINVACGGHAGSAQSMRACLQWAQRRNILAGAHPGYPDRLHFGRKPMTLSPDNLELLLLHQIGALQKIASSLGVRLHHVKLHGALYHAAEEDKAVGHACVRAMSRWWPRLIIYARAGGRLAGWAREKSLRVWEEAFIDRSYNDDGTLVPRGRQGAVLVAPRDVESRVRDLTETGMVRTVTGRALPLRARTMCLHADHPHALRTARIAARMLKG